MAFTLIYIQFQTISKKKDFALCLFIIYEITLYILQLKKRKIII
jgi:hypothetical protein